MSRKDRRAKAVARVKAIRIQKETEQIAKDIVNKRMGKRVYH